MNIRSPKGCSCAGGANTSSGEGIYATGTSTVIVSGGTIGATGSGGRGLSAIGNSVIEVIGGTINDGGTVYGGPEGYGLLTYDHGTIDLFSKGDSPFFINGIAMNNKTLGQYTPGYGGIDRMTGILLNGAVLNTTFFNLGTINFNLGTPPAAVPEASTTVSFGLLLLLGLGGVVICSQEESRCLCPSIATEN